MIDSHFQLERLEPPTVTEPSRFDIDLAKPTVLSQIEVRPTVVTQSGELTFPTIDGYDASRISDAPKLRAGVLDSLNVPLGSIISKDALSSASKGESVKMSDDLRFSIDRTYNVARFEYGKYPNLNTVNMWLNREGTGVTRIDNTNGEPIAASLARVADGGGISSDALGKLGLSQTDISDARQRAIRDRELLSNLTGGDLASLPNSYEYKGSRQNTDTVLQGEAVIIDPAANPNFEGLYTFGAGPCAVLTLVGKDADGSVKSVALAHIDAGVSERDLSALIGQMENPGVTLTANVISGEAQTALRIGNVLKDRKVPISFANVDLDGSRSDAVLIDRSGKVYFGERQDLVNVSPTELDATALKRQLVFGSQGSTLDFKRTFTPQSRS